MRAAVIAADDNPTDSVMHIGNINGFELKSFIDECFQMKSVQYTTWRPLCWPIVGRIYHNIADGGISIGSMSLHQMVSQTLTHLDAVLKPIWHLLFANYMDLHSKHSDADDDDKWWEEDPTAFRLLLIVFPGQNVSGRSGSFSVIDYYSFVLQSCFNACSTRML